MKAKYDQIGVNYNLTRSADPYLFETMHQLLSPSKYGTYLEIGCGTGNYTKEFDKKGYHFIGIDPSEEMLQKARSTPSSVDWRKGTAEEMDLLPESVDGALASLTLHHWQDFSKGIAEVSRVLKPDGKFVIFTSLPSQMKRYWLGHYFPKMLEDSIKQMPSFEEIRKAMVNANLEMSDSRKYFVHPQLTDLFLNSGKHRPEQYLNPEIRAGISSFAAVANEDEVQEGLERLKSDIESGEINDILHKFENEEGDYMFISAKK